MISNVLSIRLLPGGLSISGSPADIVPGPDVVAQQKEYILTYLEQLPQLPEEIEVEVCTERLTLAPQADAQMAEQMYRFVLPKAEREEVVMRSQLEFGDSPLLQYGMDAELYHFMERNLPQARFTHPIVSLHSICCQRSRQFGRPVLFAHADEHAMSLLLYDNQQLQLAMRYDTRSVANRAFYLLNTWQQMKLDQQLDHLLLIGHPAHINQLRARIVQYIKRTEMMIVNDN